MDSKVEMFLKRARSEIDTAEILFLVSKNKEQKNSLNISEESTFYSGVISHAYYAIFYCAKALLLAKHIETSAPEIHKKTFNAFKETFIDTGIMNIKLLLFYQYLIIRAESLLEIYRIEKKKRGDFTYNTIPQANQSPAEESIKHAKDFFKHCSSYMSYSS
jgi:uncharacterized protein (UPF0332 family)